MAAFMIVYARISDPNRFGAYAAAVLPVLARHGGRLVGRSAPAAVLEGDWTWQSAAVFEFASVAAIHAFWSSAEYDAVRKLRAGAAEFQAIVVEGTAAPKP